MNETSRFHDTYYVVAHAEYLISLLALFLVGWALWTRAQRWSDTDLTRLRRAIALAFLLGCTLVLIPLAVVNLTAGREFSSALTYFQWANRAALLGFVIVIMACLVTALTFIRTALQRFGR